VQPDQRPGHGSARTLRRVNSTVRHARHERISTVVKRTLVVAALVFIGPPAQTQVSDLNLSTDLTRLGIAAQNMVPDQRDLDSGPLLNAAISYIASRGIRRVTLNPGSYYLLTPRSDNGRYLYAAHLEGVTFDFGGAHLYLQDAYRQGLSFFNVKGVTLRNFTLDYLELPFTQVRVTEVRAAERTLRYELVSGYRDPLDFNEVRNHPAGTSPNIYALVFRDGRLVDNTGRMSIALPLTPGVVRFIDTNAVSTANVVAGMRPGDTLVILGRDGTAAINCGRCAGVTISDVDVYAASAQAVTLDSATEASSNASVWCPGQARIA
jgi:hypothetical protein